MSNHLIKKHRKNSSQGYMLIEILVSLVIFSIVVVISSSAILAIVEANTKSQTTKSVMDNLSVAIENMSRTMRIGTEFKCISGHGDPGSNTSSCSAGSAGVSFVPQDATAGERMEYYFRSGVLYRNRGNIEIALTAPEVVLTDMKFYVLGASTNDGQPRIFININGEAGTTRSKSEFNMQTTVSQRQPDNS
jgi:type II secretory pathway pseudopilin PulG